MKENLCSLAREQTEQEAENIQIALEIGTSSLSAEALTIGADGR